MAQTGLLLLKLIQRFTGAQKQLADLPLVTKVSIGKTLKSGNELLKRIGAMLIHTAITLGSSYEDFFSNNVSPLAEALSQLPLHLSSTQLASRVEETLFEHDSNTAM